MKADYDRLLKYLTKHQMTSDGALRILGRSMSSTSIIFGSDFHVGSIYAICSPHPTREDGLPIKPAKQQVALYSILESVVDRLSKKAKLFVVNGEPIDGANRRSNARGAWTSDLGDQITDFGKIIKIIPYERLLLTRGSAYHVDLDGTNFEELTANQLGAEAYRAYGGSGKTDYQANIEVHGKIFNVTHHVGYARWWQYRPTSLAQEMVKMHFDHAKRKFHTDAMIRSHVHYYCQVKFLNTIGVTTPAWKLPDPFMYRSGLPMMPDVGLIEAIIESNGDIEIVPLVEDVDIEPMVKHIK